MNGQEGPVIDLIFKRDERRMSMMLAYQFYLPDVDIPGFVASFRTLFGTLLQNASDRKLKHLSISPKDLH